MTNLQKKICMECGKEFKQDMDDPKVIESYKKAGIVAQQCNKCMLAWLSEE